LTVWSPRKSATAATIWRLPYRNRAPASHRAGPTTTRVHPSLACDSWWPLGDRGLRVEREPKLAHRTFTSEPSKVAGPGGPARTTWLLTLKLVGVADDGARLSGTDVEGWRAGGYVSPSHGVPATLPPANAASGGFGRPLRLMGEPKRNFSQHRDVVAKVC
jgi:hypothetical protein